MQTERSLKRFVGFVKPKFQQRENYIRHRKRKEVFERKGFSKWKLSWRGRSLSKTLWRRGLMLKVEVEVEFEGSQEVSRDGERHDQMIRKP